MSIVDIKPTDVSPELRIRIEHVSRREKLSWQDTLVFLASEVVSPKRKSDRAERKSFRPRVVSP